MRYFWIYANEENQQPGFNDWFRVVGPGRKSLDQVYQCLKNRNHFKVSLPESSEFMDVVSFPQFMVSPGFANVIRMYDPAIRFRNLNLFDGKNHRNALYQLPRLPEIECLSDDSVLSRDGSEIKNGSLMRDRIIRHPIFQIKDVSTRYVIANLELVESLYRRQVMGMRIEEFVVK